MFGQGVLDAGKAVRGPARLDVNRMSPSSVKAYDEFGGSEYVFESFDTQGHMAVSATIYRSVCGMTNITMKNTVKAYPAGCVL